MAVGHVRFENVWKRFHRGPQHDSLRDLIPTLMSQFTRRREQAATLHAGDFWALRDVSFEVVPGQALGIIGGNGAGKSTALKLLTKVLQVTRGTAEITGRSGALIEVSAGFHPDLTGRENVFLQGAIMGMSQRMIRDRFDQIVEFSGIGHSIDTPVKRYSSGMNARLGFSIAVHLEPDVLIIDEVLSVGDAEFQERAFGRVRALARSGIPIVMVSHQLDRIVELCTECILLNQGEVAYKGDPAEAVHRYIGKVPAPTQTTTDDAPIRLIEIEGPDQEKITSGELTRWVLHGEVRDSAALSQTGIDLIVVNAANNQQLCAVGLWDRAAYPAQAGPFSVDFSFMANLPAGLYRIDALVGIGDGILVGQAPPVLFQVHEGPSFRGTHQLNIQASRRGAELASAASR